MRLLLAFLLSFVGLIEAARAQAPAPNPVAHFAKLPFISSPRMSPDGNRVAALIAANGTQMLAIWRFSGDDQLALVALGDSDLNWWEWVNDDYLVAGVGGVDKLFGVDLYFRRAVSISADGKQIRMLVKGKAAQNADDVVWIANDGSPRILLGVQTSLYAGDRGFSPDVYEVDVATGKSDRVVASTPNVWSWHADSSGVVRMGVGYTDRQGSFLLYRPGKGQAFRTIHRPRKAKQGEEDLIAPALFTADPAKAIAFSDHEGFDALYELDLAGMAVGAPLLKVDGYDVDSIIPNQARDAMIGAYYTDTRARVKWFDPDLALVQSQIDTAVNGRRADIVSMSRDRQKLIVRLGGPSQTGAYYFFDRDVGRMQKFAEVSEAFGNRPLAPVSTIRYKARDGLEISAVLTVPAGREAKNLPLILMPHGGPFARDSEEWDWWVQFLADRGYAILQPNYRGSSGFGKAFAEKAKGQWGLAMQDDLDDAVAWAVRSGLADPARVCIAGASYGGYAALRAASRNGGAPYRCAVSFAGVSDLGSMVRYDSRFLFSRSRRAWLRDVAPDFKAVSPVHHAANFAIPTLIMHGKKDRTVPPGQSRDMAEKLQKAGKSYIYIEQPEGDHHFSREADRLQFLTELEAFLKKHNPA